MNRSRSFFPLSLLFAAVPAAAQGFVDRTADFNLFHEIVTGFDSVAGSTVSDFTQRGVALGDLDGDGDLDMVLCGGVLPNTVLRNDGTTFTDITGSAGIEAGDFDTTPCLADFDRDGDLDLFISVVAAGGDGTGGVAPASRFYRNNGDATFEEITTLANARGSGHSIFAQWVDLDYDGLVDLLVGEFYTTPNHFYRNNGDGTFTDVSVATGLDTPGSTHVTCVVDSDNDGYLDVFVGNDYIVSFWSMLPNNAADVHMQGQSDGTWIDVSAGSAFDHPRGVMGYAIGDVNYDGLFDIYKTDVESNRLAVNQGWPGGGAWLAEEQFAYGIECDLLDWPEHPSGTGKAIGWGCSFQDFNFDLWLDLMVINGQVAGFNPSQQFSPRDQQNFLYTGDGPGAGFTFTDSSAELGFDNAVDDRCSAIGDIDEDGDLDVVVSPTVGSTRYYENQIDPAGQGWLMVKPVCNTSAAGGFGVMAEFTDSMGYPHKRLVGLDGQTASQNDNFAYFGLGSEASVDLTVEFPSGLVLSYPATTPNQVITAVEPELVHVNAHTLPIGPNPSLPGNRNAPTGTTPSELYVVTAYAHDQAGSPLDATATVTIETPGLTALTGVLSIGGNAFRRYYEAPASPGEYRSEVSFDGWTVKIRPRVHFYDPGDASGTTVTLVPEAVQAGSSQTFDVIVAPKDANGISLGSADTVDIQIAGLTALSGPTDLGDGRYRATFPAPATAGFHAVTLAVNGSRVTSVNIDVEAGGPAINSLSTLDIEEPNILTSGAPWQMKVLVVPRDINGARLGPYVPVELVVIPGGGTDAVTVRSDLFPLGQRDGSFAFVLEKPYTDPPTTVTGTIQLFVDGNQQLNIPYNF
ncbi:MAG: FG-GAP-like repeat-containing protein [Planctomycetota bacterium]